MRFVKAICVVVSAISLASCGSSTTNEVVETPVVPDGGVADVILGNDCLDAAAAFSAVSQGVLMGMMDPSSLDVEMIRSNIEKARAAVPEAIADDFVLFSEAYITVGEALAEVNANGGLANPENAARFEELTKELEDPELEASAERVGQYFMSECTID